MSGVARFDCYPSDFLNGMVGMTADQIAVYTTIIFMQYDRGEAILIEGREREIAIRAGMTRNRLAKAIEGLVALGKLHNEDGHVFNDRTEKELAKIRVRIAEKREFSAKGGEATRQKFNTNDNKNSSPIGPDGQPNGQPDAGLYSPPPLPLPPPGDSPLRSESLFAADEMSAAERPKKKAARASRLPHDWKPSPESRQFSIAEIGEHRTDNEFAKFCDYWRAKGGKDATKLDWNMTWRNWIRTAKERIGSAPREGPPVAHLVSRGEAW